MARINRAAQFAPFNALTGLHAALKIKELEREREVRGELTEEQTQELIEANMALLRDEQY